MDRMKKMKFSVEPNTGCLSEENAKRYFSVIGLAAFSLMLVFRLGVLVLSGLLYRFAPALLSDAVVKHFLNLIPLYCMAFPVFYLILRRLPRGVPSAEPVGPWQLIGGFGICLVMTTVGNTVGQFVASFFASMMGPLSNPTATLTDGAPFWVNLVFMAIIPGILEELLIRKVMCDRLLPLGEGYAVVISAVVFGLIHGNFFQFFYATALGLIFAVIYVKTGKIWITALFHCLINFFGSIVALWLLEQVAPAMEESFLIEMEKQMAEGNIEALSAMLDPFMLPMLGIFLYEGVALTLMILGLVYFFKRGRRIKFQKGLLPVPEECRISSVFLNVGAAAALTLFAGVFLLSLL